MNYMKNKILVTGAGGFIGSVLCKKLLKLDFKLTVLLLPGETSPLQDNPNIKILFGDITKSESIKGLFNGIDIVYHLAGRVHHYGRRKLFYDAIYYGTENLLNETINQKIERFIYISSFCACGMGRHLNGLTEEDPVFKTGASYADAKLDAENLVKEYGEKYNLKFSIVRPSNVIGPNSVWVKDMIATQQKSLIFPVVAGGKYNAALVSVDNLVDGLILVGTKDVAENQTYHFRDDWDVTWKEYLKDMEKFVDKKIRTIKLPFFLAWNGSKILERLANIFNIKTNNTMLMAGIMGRDLTIDTTKAQTELGWKSKVSYAEELEQITDWVNNSYLINNLKKNAEDNK